MTKQNIIYLAVFLLIALPQLTLSSSVTVGDNQPWDMYAFKSVVKLASLYTNQTVSAYIQYTPSSPISLALYAADGTQVGSTQTCATSPCTASFAKIPIAGSFYLTIFPQTGWAAGGAYTIYIAQVNVFGDSKLRTSNILYQATLALQQARYHKIYVASSASTLAVNFKNLVATQIDYVKGTPPALPTRQFIYLYKETTTVNAIPSADIAGTMTSDAVSVTYTYTISTAGFYWILINGAPSLTASAAGWTYTVNYSTDRYECPFDASYPDLTQIYNGCVFPISVSTFPCLTYDIGLARCNQCINGYTLSAGTCLENNCTTAQYKHYGVCYALPENCLSYNVVLGCTKCLNANFNIVNKVCTKIPLNCTGRTYYDAVNYVCANVSALCNTFDAASGNCLTCLSAANQVVNGSCVAIPVPTCAERQYALNGVCYNVDSLCSTFVFIGGQCISCIQGFKLTNGTCVQIQCPNRYTPDVYGNCKLVSPLCDVYIQNGFCLKCVAGYGADPNGQCLQFFSPNPCAARQYLGIDGNCKINEYCNATNPWDSSCASCSIGYYLLYTGECVVQVNCKPRQYIVNNVCYNVSTTCGNYNTTNGKCINCVSSNYQLYFGLCIPTVTCGSRQWVDTQGQCQDVSALCSDFNPTTGACITCVDKTKIIQNGACVASVPASTNHCSISSSTMGCLQCDTGFIISYNSSNGLGICV